jgi:hypothetical protein
MRCGALMLRNYKFRKFGFGVYSILEPNSSYIEQLQNKYFKETDIL